MSRDKTVRSGSDSLRDTEARVLREQFPIVDRCIYLNHAAVGPISLGVQAAMHRQTSIHVQNITNASALSAPIYAQGRALAADLVGAAPQRVAYIQNTSFGLSQIALGLDWQPGDNVVVPALEFPSNFLVWSDLQRKGVELRCVEAPAGRLDAALFEQHVDERTRVVAVSHVQFYSGFRVELADIAELCHRCDALLVVDGTQSVGAMPFDMRSNGADVVVVSAHKWMLGPLGIGFTALSERAFERIRPSSIGWLSVEEPFAFRRLLEYPPDASRFEPGTENAAGIYGLVERLQEIETLGLGRITSTIHELLDNLIEGLRSAGLEIASILDPEHRSGIILARHHKIATDDIHARLQTDDIVISVRNGALRFSPHHYNTHEEMHRVRDAVRSAVRG